MTDPTQRFSKRVDNYIKYRPSYPAAVVDLLMTECGLTGDAVIADIGSGTGLLSELFLKHGNQVIGIEPNAPMRAAGERVLGRYERFTSVDGKAEATTLPDASVDFVTAGQAFHWFDPTPTGAEWRRILRPDGWVVLVWNDRQTDSTPFLRDYEALLQRFGTDYLVVSHKEVDNSDLVAFFGRSGFQSAVFPNQQRFDYAGLEGRLLSSSYVPDPGHEDYEPMLAALRLLFDRYADEGHVAIEYDTRVYYGHL